MSTPSLSSLAVAAVPPPPSASPFGLGYLIAIALVLLVLLSSLVLASYLCCRRRRHDPAAVPSPAVFLPRVIFVAEGEEDEESGLESGVVGLDAAVVNSYPKFPYCRGSGDATTCAICLCEYREGEMMRMLPDCRHVFHLGCVDAWLKLNASCPVCRSSPLPTPLSTPLSEVVPLSQYSDGRRRR